FRRCDEIGGAKFVVLAPPAPVGKLFHCPAEVRFCAHRGTSGSLTVRIDKKDANKEHNGHETDDSRSHNPFVFKGRTLDPKFGDSEQFLNCKKLLTVPEFRLRVRPSKCRVPSSTSRLDPLRQTPIARCSSTDSRRRRHSPYIFRESSSLLRRRRCSCPPSS